MIIYSISDELSGIDNSEMSSAMLRYISKEINVPINVIKISDTSKISANRKDISFIVASDNMILKHILARIKNEFASRKETSCILMFDAFEENDSKNISELLQNGIPIEDIIHVGTRGSATKSTSSMKLKDFSMREISFEGIEETCNSVMGACRQYSNVIMHINLNVLDPAYAGSIINKSVGGMSTRELEYMLQRIRMINNTSICLIFGFDLAEDKDGLSKMIAARIIHDLS